VCSSRRKLRHPFGTKAKAPVTGPLQGNRMKESGSSFRHGCRNPASRDGKLSADTKPESGIYLNGKLPSMAWIPAIPAGMTAFFAVVSQLMALCDCPGGLWHVYSGSSKLAPFSAQFDEVGGKPVPSAFNASPITAIEIFLSFAK